MSALSFPTRSIKRRLAQRSIEPPNLMRACDITYVPIGTDIFYLVAVMDCASRAALSWRLSNTMDASFRLEALGEAMARFGKPENFNTDQGSQFPSQAFTPSPEPSNGPASA